MSGGAGGPGGARAAGDGAAEDPSAPEPCFVAVDAGYRHTCARRSDGSLWCWGFNYFGQLGNGSTGPVRDSPVRVQGLGASVVEVSTGWSHTCARNGDSTLWCWGDNKSGQLGDGSSRQTASPVQVSALGTSVVEVAAHGAHTCARTNDDPLWCWGGNFYGQLGNGTAWDSSSPVQVSALEATVAQVAVGSRHTCAVTLAGELWCWGNNIYGQLGDGTDDQTAVPVQVTALGSSVVEVTAGIFHTCARKVDGTLWCWGDNSSGQLGDGTIGSIVMAVSSPVPVSALGTGVVEVSAGASHTCARKDDGTLWCWGNASAGELGTGALATAPEPLPVQVSALGNSVVQVTTGGAYTCASTTDGTLWCWGFAQDGAIGGGTQQLSPCGDSSCRPEPFAVGPSCQ